MFLKFDSTVHSMALPMIGKREPKVHSVTVRLSANGFKKLKLLSKDCGLSQAAVIEYLILQEANCPEIPATMKKLKSHNNQ